MWWQRGFVLFLLLFCFFFLLLLTLFVAGVVCCFWLGHFHFWGACFCLCPLFPVQFQVGECVLRQPCCGRPQSTAGPHDPREFSSTRPGGWCPRCGCRCRSRRILSVCLQSLSRRRQFDGRTVPCSFRRVSCSRKTHIVHPEDAHCAPPVKHGWFVGAQCASSFCAKL